MKPEFLDFDACLRQSDGYLVTVNMQHLYESRRSADLAQGIFDDPNARLCIDGRGAQKLFERLLGRPQPRVAGNELVRARLAQSAGKRVLVVGSLPEVMAKVVARFPEVDFVHDGSRFPAITRANGEAVASDLLRTHGSDFDSVMIALGVPKQEMLAQALVRLLPGVPILCIGGSFEMLAGIYPRSPALVQRLGLEGVWRLVLEPSSKRVERMVMSYASFVGLMLRPDRLASMVGAGK